MSINFSKRVVYAFIGENIRYINPQGKYVKNSNKNYIGWFCTPNGNLALIDKQSIEKTNQLINPEGAEVQVKQFEDIELALNEIRTLITSNN